MKRAVSPWWYAVAAAFAIVGLGAALVLGLSVVGSANDAEIHTLGSKGLISLGAGRLAVYVDTTASGRVSDVTCDAFPTSGRPPIRFVSPDAKVRINKWQRVALSPKKAPEGDYVLRCAGANLQADNVRLGAGHNPKVVGIVVRTFGAIAIGVAGLVIALVITLITVVRQRSAR